MKRSIKELDALPARAVRSLPTLTLEEGAAMIRARRRGAALAAIADVMGLSIPGVSYALGQWAVNHADVSGRGRK